MEKQKAYEALFEAAPFLMQANIGDDIEYDPKENPEKWAEDLQGEVDYEKGSQDSPYSQEELDKLQEVINKVLNKKI